jgi:hypothetical protein
LQLRKRNAMLSISTARAAPMPTWPPVAGKRSIFLELPPQHLAHLDAQAAYQGCSRAAYLRRLVVTDRDREPAHTSIIPCPPGDNPRAATFEMLDTLVDHLDLQAARHDCSRAAFIRHLIARDIRRNGPAR